MLICMRMLQTILSVTLTPLASKTFRRLHLRFLGGRGHGTRISGTTVEELTGILVASRPRGIQKVVIGMLIMARATVSGIIAGATLLRQNKPTVLIRVRSENLSISRRVEEPVLAPLSCF